VVLWGAGGFGPTSRGHASAPNKALRKGVGNQGIDIRPTVEDFTSQRTACCLLKSAYSVQSQQARTIIGPLSDVPLKRRVLRGLLYCKRCASVGTSSLFATTMTMVYLRWLWIAVGQRKRRRRGRRPPVLHGTAMCALPSTSFSACT
jgi:hypothetical protein